MVLLSGKTPNQSLQQVIDVGYDLKKLPPTTDKLIKFDGTNVVWSDATSKLTSGCVSNPEIIGSVVFPETLSKIPLISLTVDVGPGSTSIIVCSLAGVSLSGFNFICSSTDIINLYWTVIGYQN